MSISFLVMKRPMKCFELTHIFKCSDHLNKKWIYYFTVWICPHLPSDHEYNFEKCFSSAQSSQNFKKKKSFSKSTINNIYLISINAKLRTIFLKWIFREYNMFIFKTKSNY